METSPIPLGETRPHVLGQQATEYLRAHGYTPAAVDFIVRMRQGASSASWRTRKRLTCMDLCNSYISLVSLINCMLSSTQRLLKNEHHGHFAE